MFNGFLMYLFTAPSATLLYIVLLLLAIPYPYFFTHRIPPTSCQLFTSLAEITDLARGHEAVELVSREGGFVLVPAVLVCALELKHRVGDDVLDQ